MSGKNKKPLIEQLQTCQRRLEGHLKNKNSNPERFYRLLVRQAQLEQEIGFSRRSSSSRKRRSKS